MPSALDVAAYILEKIGPVTTMKLQKLVYYSQVWSIVWDDDSMFEEAIEAWDNGPVVRRLWNETKPKFRVGAIESRGATALGEVQVKTVDRVLHFYGEKDAQWLSDLTHMEAPWKEAYAAGRNSEISLERISEYYSSLPPADVQAGS